MAHSVVASLLLVSLLLASANGLCVLGLISLPLLCPSPCNLLGLISSQCRQTGVSLTLTGGTIVLDANILSLQLSTWGSSLVTVKLGDMNITTDLILNGNVLLSVASGVTAGVGGLLEVSSNAVLDVAGSLIVGGTATINGKLKLSGEHSTNAIQTAWIHAHSLVVSGSIGQPGSIEGNGGVDADVQFSGQTTTGQPFANNSIYIAKNVSVTASSTLKVNGNITVEGGSSIFGILHLAGPKLAGNAQAVWYNSLSDAFVVKGSQNKAAKITGNGGITGNVYMGDFGGLSPGNSPGKVSFNGDLLMSTNSFTEIEAESFSANGFDQYIIKNHFYRDGYLYITFLNGFVPTVNNRFNFGAHSGSSGTFHTVMTMDGYEVTAAYSDRSTTFVFSDPVTPAYCTCTSTF